MAAAENLAGRYVAAVVRHVPEAAESLRRLMDPVVLTLADTQFDGLALRDAALGNGVTVAEAVVRDDTDALQTLRAFSSQVRAPARRWAKAWVRSRSWVEETIVRAAVAKARTTNLGWADALDKVRITPRPQRFADLTARPERRGRGAADRSLKWAALRFAGGKSIREIAGLELGITDESNVRKRTDSIARKLGLQQCRQK